MKKAIIRNFTLLVSFILLAIILINTNWQLVIENLHYYNIISLLYVVLLFALINILRAIRSYYSLPPVRPDLITCFNISMQHGFFLSVLPIRLGDIYYISMLKNQAVVPTGLAFTSLLSIRIYDVITLCILGLLVFSQSEFSTNSSLQFILYILLISGIFLAFFLRHFLLYLGKILTYFCQRFNINRMDNLDHKVNELNRKLIGFMKINTHLALLFSSIATWLLVAGIFYTLTEMFYLSISYYDAILLAVLVNMANLIPIQTIGGFGLRETALIFGFTLLGMKIEQATIYAILIRLTVYILPVIFGLPFVLKLYKTNTMASRSI